MRRSFVAAALVPLVAVPAFSASATPAGSSTPKSYGLTLNILPPGANGNVDAGELAQLFLDTGDKTATKDEPANYANQLEMYDALNTVAPYSLSGGDLTNYYKDGALGAPAKPASVETPKDGVTIARDSFGVPHIIGKTDYDVAYGAGYAGIEDRMFLTDILRHTGAAQMASFLGPTDADIAMDQSQLQLAPYTRAEADAQLKRIAKRYGAEGQEFLDRLDAFVAGMNDAQAALCPLAFDANATGQFPGDNGAGFGPNCPAEYAALQKAPSPYQPSDIVYIASLVGGIFGKGGGSEYQAALFYEALKDKFGAKRASAVYSDLREKNDPEAFTTASKPFPYLTGPLSPGKSGVAMPVPGAASAPGSGAPASSTEPVPFQPVPVPGTAAYQKWESTVGQLQTPLGSVDLMRHPKSMSNALLVDAQHSANGHPVVVFGPQTGYYTPQLLTEVDLEGPHYAARGVSFAGTQAIVELGHGVDYAWSATSASSDNVDTVMERLCNPDGSKPTVDSTHYIDDSSGDPKCVPIDTYTHSESIALPTAGGTAPPQYLTFQVMRTRHGVVQFRTLAKLGDKQVPVAVVSERSTYGHELDSAVGFMRINDPTYVHNAHDFERAFNAVDYTFNWFYADSRDIAYKGSGLLPERSGQIEPDFPRWGDAKYDWHGWLPARDHPHQINPPSGLLSSWNNKQAPRFGTADDEWGQGSKVHRVNLLVERIKALFHHEGDGVTPAALVGAMIDAGTVDLRAEKLLPLALKVVGHDKQDADAVTLLKQWVHDGAHRVDRDRDGSYGDQAAIALFDTWWDDKGKGDGGLAQDTMRHGLGKLVDALPQKLDDHPRQGLGSSWNNVAWYGYVSKTLRAVLGMHVQDPYSQHYCGSLATCRKILRDSLHTAVQRALAAQGVDSVNKLTYDKTEDDIRPVTAGVVGTRNIDWQNRPTFQQVINFTQHR